MRTSESNAGVTILRVVIGLLELWVLAIVLILGTAFVMGLLGANADTPFAAWIFARAGSLMTPFNGIFDPIVLTGDTVIQTSLLFAAVVYAVLGSVLSAIGRRFY